MLRRLASRPGSLLTLLGVGFFMLLAVVGPFFAPYDPAGLGHERWPRPVGNTGWAPTVFGRDVFSRFLYGSRVSILVGFGAVALCAGARHPARHGGRAPGRAAWATSSIMRLMDVILSFPLLVWSPSSPV